MPSEEPLSVERSFERRKGLRKLVWSTSCADLVEWIEAGAGDSTKGWEAVWT